MKAETKIDQLAFWLKEYLPPMSQTETWVVFKNVVNTLCNCRPTLKRK